jgi:MraZ protein
MSAFYGSVTNKIDAKGRISVPARFRAVIGDDAFQGVWCFASFVAEAIEGYTAQGMEKYAEQIRKLDKYSVDRESFEHSVLGSVHDLSFDSEGRILLPEQLLRHAHLLGAERATFVGLGDHFEIWEPQAYDEKVMKARAIAAERRLMLDAPRGGTPPQGGAR